MSLSTLRASALQIFHAALDAANPRIAIQRALVREDQTLRVNSRVYDLTRIARIFVVGFGKASAAMAQAVEEILGDRIAAGFVTVKYGYTAPTRVVKIHEAGHPLPDENSLRGAEAIVRILQDAREDDLVLCLISGGGSALLELPVEGVTLANLRATTDALLRCGATINEMNAVRKHLSRVKGGQLARFAFPALAVSLILSDVIDSPLDVIASGPTALDPTTFADAARVIEKYHLRDGLPKSVVRHLERAGNPETPKADDLIFARVQNVIIADNSLTCAAAANKARELGFDARVVSTRVQGEAREVGQEFARLAKADLSGLGDLTGLNRPACLIAGGETTVHVRGSGLGGRNQELALAAAIELDGTDDIVVLSAGTDGTDGPTDAAGAIADGTTLTRARALGLDARAFLANNDAYHFFAPLGDLIMTGPTNMNVNDVILTVVG